MPTGKRHLCVDCRHLANYTDGLARYVYDIMLALAAQSVTHEWKITALVVRGVSLNTDLKEAGVQLMECDVKAGALSQHWKIPSLLRQIRPDVYYYPFIDPPLFCTTKRRYFAIHDLNHYFFSKYAATERWYAILYTKFMLQIASWRYHGIVTFSRYVENQVKKNFIGAKHTTAIYHGLSTDHFSGEEPSSLPEKYLLYVGNNRPHKNLPYLLECFNHLHLSDSSYHLVLAGNHMDRFETEQHWRQRFPSLNDAVHVIQRPTQMQVNSLYRHAHAVVNLSVSEGFGFPILEAWYFQKPIIILYASCFPEIAGDVALYVQPNDMDSFVQAVYTSATPSRVNAINNAGSERLKEYDWSLSAMHHLSFFST